MANNQIMVNMKFQADTTQAKAKMQELQNSLKSLQSVTSMDLPLGKTVSGLQQAKNAAAQLQIQLQTAFNQDTGKLDLTRFNQSLKQSNMNLQQYKNLLSQAGPIGQQAFGQLAVQIASADTHVIRISQRLVKLGTTLANTLRWQISSATLMAVTSTISEAYSFAQDLNESLNEIRIVTGNSADQMARFAKEANNAAKVLSTTTTKYTDASLIYFQQGLNEKQVKERTDLTIKMANVTGQSVSQVSDQLTAVWNNFDDGTKTLEYYVDVMTALGAATASSSEEISEGLNKFAAVAETVGLSYEYAAAALATVTATTRQSADIVGTAFKTLFARIQDLELGETLDDGTTMGQYSQALAAVGINIKDVNGEVKDMNIILDEMGAKWNTLTKDTQIALAQNVAGVRQYTQLIALMDNWSYFQENLNTAYTSAGTLQEQADIYAESWEAARDRVTAALEDIYQDILVDDTFIAILDFFANLLENIDNVIESVGGLNGVLTILAAVLLKVYQNSIATSLSSMGTTMMSWTKAGQAKINQTRTEAYNEATTIYNESNASGKLGNENIRNQINTETRYNELTINATEQQKAILNIRKESIQKQNEENEKLIEELRTLEQITAELNKQVVSTPYEKNKALYSQNPGNIQQASWESLETISKQSGASQIFGKELQLELYDDRTGSYLSGDYSDKSLNKANDATSEIIAKMESLRFGADGAEKELKELFGEEVYNALEKYYQKLKETQQTILSLQKDSKARESAKIEQDSYNSKKTRINVLNKNGKKMTPNERKEYRQLEKDVAAYEEKQGQLVKTSNEVDKAVGKTNVQLEKQTNAMIKARGSTEEAENEVRNLVSSNQQLTQKTTETSIAIGKTKKDVDQLNTTLANSMGPVTFSQKLTTFASMAMSASMALQGFKSLIDTWNNEDISFGDKLIQSMMSIGMILPALTTLMNKQNMARLFGVNAMKLENGQWIFNTQQKSTNTVVTWLQKVAQDALNGSILATLGMFGLFLVAVAAVIGVIYLLIKAQEKEKTALEKATEAAKNQREALKSITEAAKEMTTALEEAKDLISSYSEVSSAFDGLVQGSDAYNENLQKEIELINQLLEKYPELEEMGIIKNGKVVDQAALQQYIIGTATIDMLNMQIAQKYAAQDSEILDAEQVYQDKLEEINSDLNKQKEISAWDSQNKVGIRDGKGNTWYISAGTSNVEAQYKAASVNSIFEGWQYRLLNGETLEDIGKGIVSDEYSKQLFTVFKEYTEAQEEYVNQIKDLDEEHLLKLKEINKKYEAQYLVLANQILSYQKGFSQLNQFQQSASAKIVANEIQDSKTSFKTGEGEEFSGELGDYILKATGISGSWSDKITNEGKDPLNDIGDFFVNTKEGTQAIAAYLREVKGLSDMSRSMLNDGTYTFDSKGMKSGDDSQYDIDLNWAEIAGYYAGQQAYEDIDYAKRIQEASKRSDATNAAIGGTIAQLSEEQIARIATGSRESGEYKLKEYSTDIQEAAKALKLEGAAYDSWISNLEQQLKDYDAALAETLLLQQDMQKGNQIIAEASEKYDLNAETVENYAKSLYNANKAQGVTYESAAKLAIVNGRLSKGIDTLRDKWFDISRTLNTTSKNSYEWMEAATEASQALEEMFGVVVSTDFIDTYSDKITTLVNGGDEAVKVFQELELLAGQDYVMSLNLDEKYKTQFTSMLEELTSQEYEGITVGIKGKIDQSYIDSMNKLLEEGAITADEVNAMFNSIGWDPNITFEEHEETISDTTSRILRGSESQVKSGGGEETWERIVTTGMVKKPVIGKVTAAPKSTSSIKTNTTSGGSGGSKKQKKDKNTEVERYHEINEELDDLQKKYDAIGKAKDRAFGQKKLDLIEDEISATEDLISAQERLIDETKTYLENDKAKLSEYGANFDPETGRLTNYDEMYKVNIDQYNRAVDSFNAGKMSEEQFEEYEKEYEEFTKDLAQYEETLNKLQDDEEALIEYQNQLFDKKLEDITARVDLDTELAEDKLSLLDYQLKKLGNSMEDVGKKFTHFIEKSNINAGKMQTYQNAISELLNASDLSLEDLQSAQSEELMTLLGDTNLTADQIESLKEYSQALLTLNKEMVEMRDTVQDELVAAFKEMNNEAQEGIDTMDNLSSMIQGYRDIIDLVGKDNLGISNDLLAKMNQTNVDNSKNALESQKAILKANKASLAEAEQELEKARAENRLEDVEWWEETVKTLSETVTSGEKELLSRWKNSLQAAVDAYTDSVNQVMETFEKSMSGIAGSFDALSTKYDQQSEIRDRYLADYEKIYNLSKLTRNIEKSIDETDSIRAKSKLRDIQEEIYALQESGAQMTQYEVDELQARYDLRLAEIALEEAQNAKSQVRMRRDSEGNWSYVYTADEDVTAKTEQNVEDKLYAYQELTQNYIDETQDRMIQLPQEYAEAIRAIANDMTLTEEERQRRMEETTEFYKSQYEYLGQQLGIVTDDAKWLYENDWNNYSIATGYKISLNQLWIDSFNETTLAEITGYNSLSEIHTAFESSTKLMLEGITGAYNTYQTNVDTAMSNAGTSVTDFSGLVEQETTDIKEDTEEAGNKVADLAKKGQTGFKGLVDAAVEWLNDYQEAMKPYLDENEKWIISIGDIITKYADMNNALEPLKKNLDEVGEKAEAAAAKVKQVDAVDDNSGKEEEETPVNPPSEFSVSQAFFTSESAINGLGAYTGLSLQKEDISNFKISDGYGSFTYGGTTFYVQEEIAKLMAETLGIILSNATTNTSAAGGYKLYDPVKAVSLDTGGYTGSWDSSGRLAMLHQKEIVLNAHDTENFLQAINIVRDIASMIDLRAAAQQSALSMMAATSVAPMTQTLQQEVTIHAEFPNATQRTEIEAAFDTLLNRASQFANRKN